MEYRTLEFETSTKNANFLFPTPIAERDGFLEVRLSPLDMLLKFHTMEPTLTLVIQFTSIIEGQPHKF